MQKARGSADRGLFKRNAGALFEQRQNRLRTLLADPDAQVRLKVITFLRTNTYSAHSMQIFMDTATMTALLACAQGGQAATSTNAGQNANGNADPPSQASPGTSQGESSSKKKKSKKQVQLQPQ